MMPARTAPAMLKREVAQASPEAKREVARQMVLDFVQTGRRDKHGQRAHKLSTVRNHFDSLKMFARAQELGVSFPALIDLMILERSFIVTNGVVWVRNA